MWYNIEMRREPFTVGSYVHVIKRGTRGLPIVKDENDRRRFLLMLRHFNDQFCPDNWFKDLTEANLIHSFNRPDTWPRQEKLVEIICFCLVENHFHLLLREILTGGVTKFMRRLGIGMSNHYNEKYRERGSLFQGAYKLRTIDEDDYLKYVSAYIQVKNCFELFLSGYQKASKNFDQAYSWARQYPYCSLGEFVGDCERVIIDPELLTEIFSPAEYRDFCRDLIIGRSDILEDGLVVLE